MNTFNEKVIVSYFLRHEITQLRFKCATRSASSRVSFFYIQVNEFLRERLFIFVRSFFTLSRQ